MKLHTKKAGEGPKRKRPSVATEESHDRAVAVMSGVEIFIPCFEKSSSQKRL